MMAVVAYKEQKGCDTWRRKEEYRVGTLIYTPHNFFLSCVFLTDGMWRTSGRKLMRFAECVAGVFCGCERVRPVGNNFAMAVVASRCPMPSSVHSVA